MRKFVKILILCNGRLALSKRRIEFVGIKMFVSMKDLIYCNERFICLSKRFEFLEAEGNTV